MYQILKSQLRTNERHALLCLYGYNHSITGYADPRLVVYQTREFQVVLDETVFYSEDYRVIARLIFAAPKKKASAESMDLQALTDALRNYGGALILLRDHALLRAGLATVIDDSASVF